MFDEADGIPPRKSRTITEKQRSKQLDVVSDRTKAHHPVPT